MDVRSCPVSSRALMLSLLAATVPAKRTTPHMRRRMQRCNWVSPHSMICIMSSAGMLCMLREIHATMCSCCDIVDQRLFVSTSNSVASGIASLAMTQRRCVAKGPSKSSQTLRPRRTMLLFKIPHAHYQGGNARSRQVQSPFRAHNADTQDECSASRRRRLNSAAPRHAPGREGGPRRLQAACLVRAAPLPSI